MSFCKECGAELEENAKFCSECGFNVSEKKNERTIVYEGDVHKCPSCGEVLKSFSAYCPQCGHEIRNTESTNSIKEFEKKLDKIQAKVMPEFQEKKSVMKMVFGRDLKDEDEIYEARHNFERQKKEEKANCIINYSIPNTKEDILEFMILAVSNINVKELDDTETKAWITKLDQIYQKAEISIGSGVDFDKIKGIYDKKKNEIHNKKMKTIKIVFASFIGYLLLIGLMFLLGN